MRHRAADRRILGRLAELSRRAGTWRCLGEDPAAVVAAAFRKAGSYDGAAVILDADQHHVECSRRKWSGRTSVRILVAREAPELVPNRPRRGARSAAGFALNGLLRCPEPCGGLPTGTTSARASTFAITATAPTATARIRGPPACRRTRSCPGSKAEATLLRVPATA